MKKECTKNEYVKNETLLQAFEWYLPADSGHWRRLAESAKALADAGITSLWLPPAYKAASGSQDVGYGVYDTYDLGEFDQKGTIPTKYGTRQEYLDAIRSLQDNGISVLADIVLNHRMGADEKETVMADVVAGSNRWQTQENVQQIDVWSRFTFPGRAGKYSDFQWNWTHFDGTDWDDRRHRSSLFRFQGKNWESNVDCENCNYDYLMGMDLDMDNPEVLEELKSWGHWYLDTTGINGFRLDAVKHIRFSFFKEWLNDMRGYSGTSLPTVGEYWSPDLGQLRHYLNESGHSFRLFDVPLHFKFQQAGSGSGYFDMTTLRRNTLYETEPDFAVTFVDNHDTQPGQALQSWVPGWFKPLAYALILLQEKGLPCVFWGDLYGIPHDNIGAVSELPALLHLRQSHAWGEEKSYFDHCDVVGLTRLGDDTHPGLALLLSDGPGGKKRMYMGERYSGRSFHDALGKCPESVVIGSDGFGEFRTEGGSVSVWVPEH